ncbi:protein S-acyltransferase 10 isoform X2 [Beta vulgaris subsp. vulgaris]|uniref:protein S-acyltransferase 10 isoform X2 n=1 Tax=Beta vulgaris subsp. vulgaris TaxID=3555 RepID=UPI00203738DB|nr:protein S-acyltransferase 10 isoform X2 [Beta vulgaris subsp. vulgaris]
MAVAFCRDFRDRISDRCLGCFPCLSDPARRSSLCLKIALVVIHLIYLVVLFYVDRFNLIHSAHGNPWYIGLYLLLFVATLIQYFVTSGSSPGFALNAKRVVDEGSSFSTAPLINSKQSATSKNGSIVITVDGNPVTRSFPGSNATGWTKLVMEMYPPGTSMRQLTCTYCNILQPPRAKHCHDCDKCVLQFDHHCVWLGTCIGQGNHCRFWWYICEETALCLWTGILYITYLKANISRSWWMDAVMVVLLITLSISLIFLVLLLLFHRAIPERVYPFSNGICRNLYNFCCAQSSIYDLERLPTAEELEIKSRPLACSDILCCRCC